MNRLAILLAITAASFAQDFRQVFSVATPSAMRDAVFCGETGVLAGRSKAGDIILWRYPSGQQVAKRAAERPRQVRSLACSADGKLIAAGTSSGDLLLLNGALRPVKTVHISITEVQAIAFSPDSSLIAVSSYLEPARLFETGNGKLIAVLPTDFSDSNAMQFSPDSQSIAVANSDTTIRLFNRMGAPLARYDGLLLEPSGLGFTEGGKQILISDVGGNLRLLDSKDLTPLKSLPKQADATMALFAMADGTSGISMQMDPASLAFRRLLLWDLPAGTSRALDIPKAEPVGKGSTSKERLVIFGMTSPTSMAGWVLQP